MVSLEPLKLTFAVLAFALAAAGCAPGVEAAARTRASNDFNCAEDKVEVGKIGGDAYRVSGCGKEASYNCTQPRGTMNVPSETWVCQLRSTEPQPAAPSSASPPPATTGL